MVYYNGQPYQYTPGIKPAPGSPEVLNKVHEAVSYSMKSETGAKIWTEIGNHEKIVGIRFKNATMQDLTTNEFHPVIEGRKDGDNNLGTIDWDYNSRVITSGSWQSDADGNWQNGYLSPSTVLTHEGGHVYDMLKALSYGLDSKEWAQFRSDNDKNLGQDDQYETVGERKNTVNNETPYINETNAREAKQNGSMGSFNRARHNHKGTVEFRNNNADVNKNPSKAEQQKSFNATY